MEVACEVTLWLDCATSLTPDATSKKGAEKKKGRREKKPPETLKNEFELKQKRNLVHGTLNRTRHKLLKIQGLKTKTKTKNKAFLRRKNIAASMMRMALHPGMHLCQYLN